ncbi:unnamed protein product [Sphenostylis stenocarpa]|uniref:Uncharacterized protein n=1 Tax=Sphenostylis stenocarpa TaxID=92480 RepID=A0AA86S1D2_9FABA|nr:unnamed protein product [Sphenostylis stenocarpa]
MVTVEMSGPSGVFHRRRNGGDSPVVLTLEMNLAVRIRTAGMETWLMRSYVVCEFEVSSLRKDTQVLTSHQRASGKNGSNLRRIDVSLQRRSNELVWCWVVKSEDVV